MSNGNGFTRNSISPEAMCRDLSTNLLKTLEHKKGKIKSANETGVIVQPDDDYFYVCIDNIESYNDLKWNYDDLLNGQSIVSYAEDGTYRYVWITSVKFRCCKS